MNRSEMEFAVPVELDQLFNRGQVAIGVEGWTAVNTPEAQPMKLCSKLCKKAPSVSSPCLTRLELSRDVALLRTQYDVDVPIDVALTLGQPEVYFNPKRPPSDQQVACGIEKIIAPGDALTWVQAQMTPVLQRIVSLMGTLTGSALFTTKYRFRHSVRRDFPQTGCITIVAAPLDPESNALLEEWGVIKATVAVLEPHKDPGKTKITEVQQLRRVPTWAVPIAAPMHFKHQLECILDYYTSSEIYKEVTEGAGRYIVVGIRRCVKGPPLLPRQNCGIDEIKASSNWMEAEIGGVRLGLPEYLRMFLSRIGVNDIEIYDKLHGRQVVRYQAVVQLRSWERAWALLENAFRVQRAAYRKMHGGSNAPDITIDMEPKFLAVNDSNDSSTPSSIGDETPTSISCVPTARTFIHFSEKTTGARLSRVDSEPVLVLSH